MPHFGLLEPKKGLRDCHHNRAGENPAYMHFRSLLYIAYIQIKELVDLMGDEMMCSANVYGLRCAG